MRSGSDTLVWGNRRMPFKLTVSETEQIACVTASGILNLEMCIELTGNLANHPDFQPHYGLIADFRQVPNVPSRAEVRKMATFLRENREDYVGKIALVISSKDRLLAGMLCMLVRVFGMRMEMFDDMAMAMEYVSTGIGEFRTVPL